MSTSKPKDFNAILEKIRKTLDVASGNANENESAVAAAQAVKLMKKYNVSMADVIAADISSNSDSIIEENFCKWEYKTAFPRWVTNLAIRIADSLQCKVVYSHKDKEGFRKLMVRGYDSDVKIAKHVFMFLCSRIETLSEEQFKEVGCMSGQPKVTWRRSYSSGLVHSIRTKIEELYADTKFTKKQEEAGTSLVLVKEHAIEEKFGKMEYGEGKRVTVDQAYLTGFQDGHKIELMKAVENTEKEKTATELISE